MKFDLGKFGKRKDEDYDEDEYTEEEEYEDEEYEEEEEEPQPARTQKSAPKNPPVSRVNASDTGKLEMKLIKPERYDSTTAQKIADHLLSGRTVVLNLESTSKDAAKRLIDFLSGVVYSVDGNISRVSTNTVVIVPDNVNVSGEQFPEGGKRADEYEEEL